MKKIKIICIFCSCILIALSGISLAKIRVQAVERFFNDIKIKINGTEILPKDANGNIIEPFTIEGTTYLPIRAIGEALDMNVEWDATNNTVLLTTNEDFEIPKESIKEEESVINIGLDACDKVAEKEPNFTNTNLYYTSSASMEVGEQKQLSVYVYGNTSYTIDWISSNSKIASVDENGLVTAKKSGNVVITAEISNGTTRKLNVTVLDELPTIKYQSETKMYTYKEAKAKITSIRIIQNGTKLRVEGVAELLTSTNTFYVTARLFDSDGCYVAQDDFDISTNGIKAGEKTKFSENLFNGYFNNPELKRGETYYIVFE